VHIEHLTTTYNILLLTLQIDSKSGRYYSVGAYFYGPPCILHHSNTVTTQENWDMEKAKQNNKVQEKKRAGYR